VPEAIAFYRELRRRARVAHRVSPIAGGGRPGAFNFDWSLNAYPLDHRRMGPEMIVYRLRRGRCAGP
jgi:hypothetical protein